MELEKGAGDYEDNRNAVQGGQSLRSKVIDSPASPRHTPKHNTSVRDKNQDESEKERHTEERSKTRIWDADPDRDLISDGERRGSNSSFYSEDYDNESRSSRRSLSPYSKSRTPSRTPPKELRAKKTLASPFYKTGGVGVRRGATRPQRPGGQPQAWQVHRIGGRSTSKDSTPPKDLDLVTKRMLSARLLKINELRNAFAELQLRTDELQKENRVLRQLHVRQEKALQRYNDTESEIAQLLSRHSNETDVLRQRLRRAQECERAAEQRLKDSEERLRRSQATTGRLKKLAEQQDLRPREELSHLLEQEKTRALEAERRVKEVERNMELSNSSYQRQLAAERKRTVGAQEETKALQEELARTRNKLKEKERELDTKNIYANRMVKASTRKDSDIETKSKTPSRNSSKAVQTEDRTLSLDFPTPPPAINDGNEYSDQMPDDYLSLKELKNGDRREKEKRVKEQPVQERQRSGEREGDDEREMAREKEDNKPRRYLNSPEPKPKRSGDGWKNEEERRKTVSHASNHKRYEKKERPGQVQEEVGQWNQEAQVNQWAAEEERRRKDQLLAKMREIDHQKQPPPEAMLSDADRSEPRHAANGPSPTYTSLDRGNQNSIFSVTEAEESASLHASAGSLRAGSREGRRRGTGVEGGAAGTTAIGRRGLRSQVSDDELTFGSYAPTIGRPAARNTSGFPSPPPKEDRESEGVTEMERGAGNEGKGRMSSLMEQLFGTQATPPAQFTSSSNKMEVLSNPMTHEMRSRRDKLYKSESTAPVMPPATVLSTMHVVESRPTIRAIASFDDDIEEIAL